MAAYPGSDVNFAYNLSKLPPLSGVDFTSGKRVDLVKEAVKRGFMPFSGAGTKDSSSVQAFQPTTTPSTQDPFASPLGDLDKSVEAQVQLYSKLQPFLFQQQQRQAELSSWLTNQQLAQVTPYYKELADYKIARDLGASQSYRRFAEQLPSNVQNIMASKQAQMQSAQAGEADLMRAVAAQQQAAKDFAGRFAGQYISVG